MNLFSFTSVNIDSGFCMIGVLDPKDKFGNGSKKLEIIRNLDETNSWFSSGSGPMSWTVLYLVFCIDLCWQMQINRLINDFVIVYMDIFQIWTDLESCGWRIGPSFRTFLFNKQYTLWLRFVVFTAVVHFYGGLKWCHLNFPIYFHIKDEKLK